MSADALTAYVLGDIAFIIVLSTVLGGLARRCGQPSVVGQIIAGIVVGPTLLGRLPGHLTSHLFPAQVIPYLTALSEVAVALFMFVVGYEIDFRSLRQRRQAILLVASGALLLPMALGISLALFFPSGFAGTGETDVHTRSFILFMGVITAVTALPVLASIVRERGLAGTAVGVVATSAAGLMDVASWILLAAAVAGASRPAGRSWLVTTALVSGFVVVMLWVVRPTLRWWQSRSAAVATDQVTLAIVLAMAGGWASARIGLHPVFGAFLTGFTLRGSTGEPDADVLRFLDGAAKLLLPLFFVVAGLSLDIGALRGSNLGLLALIIVVAALGKLVPGYAGSRLTGFGGPQAATVAALVNTRGLTELIALNVGLQAGIIHRALFTLLVIMALFTTVMTAPLLSLIGRRQAVGSLRETIRLRSAGDRESSQRTGMEPEMRAGGPVGRQGEQD